MTAANNLVQFLRELSHVKSGVYATAESIDVIAATRRIAELMKHPHGDFTTFQNTLLKEHNVFVQEGTDLSKLNTSWGRFKFYVRHTWNQFFGNVRTIVDNQKILIEKTFDDIIATVSKLAPGKAAAAKVAANEAKVVLTHIDELKGALGDGATVTNVVKLRLGNKALNAEDAITTRVLHDLMGHVDGKKLKDYVKTLGLSPADEHLLFEKIKHRAGVITADMNVQSTKGMYDFAQGTYFSKTLITEARIAEEATKLASVEVLLHDGHLEKLLANTKNKDLKEVVDRAMGLKVDLKPRTAAEFDKLTSEGKAYVEAELNKQKDELINGKILRHETGPKKGQAIKDKKGIVQRETGGLKAEQLKIVKNDAKSEVFSLTEKQMDDVAKQRAEYTVQVNHGTIPDDRDFEGKMLALMKGHHNKNLDKANRYFSNKYLDNKNLLSSGNASRLQKDLKEYGIEIESGLLKELKTGKDLKAYIAGILPAA